VEVVQTDLGSPAELRRLRAAIEGVHDDIADSWPWPPTDDNSGTTERQDQEDEEEEEDEEENVQHAITTPGIDCSVPAPNVIVVDPGRNGMPKAFLRFLYSMDVRTIVYIGGGKPLLRDCKLLERRGYEVETMLPFDSHPHNLRYEAVTQLKRRWDFRPT